MIHKPITIKSYTKEQIEEILYTEPIKYCSECECRIESYMFYKDISEICDAEDDEVCIRTFPTMCNECKVKYEMDNKAEIKKYSDKIKIREVNGEFIKRIFSKF